MKIAVWHNLPSGGGKRALYYHVRGLVERGHEVETWCLDSADHSYLPLTEFGIEHVIPFEENLKGKRPSGAWDDAYNASVDRLRAYDEACERCAQEMEDGDFDLAFVNSALPYHIPFVTRHLSMPNVLYLQEPDRMLYEAYPVLPWVASAYEDLNETHLSRRDFISAYPSLQALRLQAKQEWLNAQASGQVLVNSYFSRESVARAYGVDAKVCYLGIDTTLFQNLGLKREPFIVGLGSLDFVKGVDRAVRAVALLETRVPLVWIANSGYEIYVTQTLDLAKSLGVDLQIKFKVSDQELVTTLNHASLLIYASRLEPFGFAPLEGNACGLPVVAVAEGGVRETIQDGVNGFLVDSEPESIARAADRLLQNPELARKMGENAALHVRQIWGVDSSVERLESFLLQASSSQPPQARPIKKHRKPHSPNGDQRPLNRQVESPPQGYLDVVAEAHVPHVDTNLPQPLSNRPARAMCTIIAKNYIAYARTLAQSFLAYHPDDKCYVLIVDDFEGFINPADECFEIVKPADLDIPNLPSFCFQYDIMELCTAVKANLLEYLIDEKSIDQLFYLDPDILVMSSCDGLFDRLGSHDIVLTPHLDKDYPDDDLLPDDGWILRAGIFNLGFIGINSSDNTRSFLDWWKTKLHRKCIVDLLNGYFVDQKFIDFVPVYFRNVFIERSVGYNVAYWNMHSRQLSRNNGHWLCNSEDLRFFHFSGYPAKEPDAISAYVSNEKARCHFSNRPDLQPLFLHYESLLIKNGHQRARSWPYTFANFKTGEPIPNELRKFYRNHSSNWQEWGDPFESPELKQKAGINPKANELIRSTSQLTGDDPSSEEELQAENQLNAILNTRVWRWAHRYDRFVQRLLLPTYRLYWRWFSNPPQNRTIEK